MNAPPPPPYAGASPDAAEARELDNFLAHEHPLDAEAALWAVRQRDGLTPEEVLELEIWLGDNPARSARLEELSGLWDQLDELPANDIDALKAALPEAPDKALQRPLADMPSGQPQIQPSAEPSPSNVQPPGHRQWLPGWGRLFPQAALAGLLAMVMGGGWLGWNQWQQQPTFEQRFNSARGQQLSVNLPDGSVLRLDSATTVDVALYRSRREVHLSKGQALFDVTHDVSRPFNVQAGPMRITVVGTRFSVSHLADERPAGRTSVFVEEGRVRVTQDNAGQGSASADSVELTAAQSVTADADGRLSPVSPSHPETAMAWRHGRVVLNDTPLVEAVAAFERYADTGLVISDPDVAALRLNGSFDLRQIPAFKGALPQALPVRLVARPDGTTEITAAH